MASQMVFTGVAGCPQFSPNHFKADMCVSCQNRIQAHAGATTGQISAALEFSVDKVPSLIWEHLEGKLFLGGYKAALNVPFLKNNNISLVVDTAKGLENVLGPKYKKMVEKRSEECPEVTIHYLPLNDDLQQTLSIEDLRNVNKSVMEDLEKGGSVIVHCAQGKSRSTTVVAAILCWALQQPVEEILAMIKTKRNMADPNMNFVRQLKDFEKLGYFENQLNIK
eukprot:GFUD01001140.1.p1 GENE.GFUD01001140.1~~GFUD01001140.1.p1  ORF type:complete len:223 (+),score=59.39 GFUD01001140.1:123-791(+)